MFGNCMKWRDVILVCTALAGGSLAGPLVAEDLGTDSLGTDSLGTDSLGTDSLGTDSLGTDSLGTDSLGTDSLGTEDLDALGQRFEAEIWPLLHRGDGKTSCVGCHTPKHSSELRFLMDARGSFRRLLDGGYLDPKEPDGLLARVAAEEKRRRMPPKKLPAWPLADIARLREFVKTVAAMRGDGSGQLVDEAFPAALLEPYRGEVPNGTDTNFISYRQLRGKFSVIFGAASDASSPLEGSRRRHQRDLFHENLALFGGADFKTRFNETHRASASFLSALDTVGAHFAARAYAQRSGPFATHPQGLPSPLTVEPGDNDYRAAIEALYRSILYRPPTLDESLQAFELLRRVHAEGDAIRRTDYTLAFELLVSDSEGGESRREISVDVSGDDRPMIHEYVNQRASVKDRAPSITASTALRHTFSLRRGDSGQTLRISNAETDGTVSFHAVELVLRGSANEDSTWIRAEDPGVRPQGAWKLVDRGGRVTLDDGNTHKGKSSISVTLLPKHDGEYQIRLHWRANSENATAVQVMVRPSRAAIRNDPLMNPPRAVVPPPGEAHFFVDQSDDTLAFRPLPGEYRFTETQTVEIHNRGTRRRVTADAVRFTDADSDARFLIDNHEAEGRDGWKTFRSGMFRAYNRVGPDTYHDENKRKGELSLRYRPATSAEFLKESRYRVAVGYPAKRDHETRTPIVVRAAASSPIVQVVSPDVAAVGSTVVLDAAATYNVQRSHLRFRWRQLQGPPISLSKDEETSPALTLRLPQRDVAATAWVALARGLLRHPDFLFTRPPSIVRSKGALRLRLQLVRLAQDLLGRLPTAEEIAQLDSEANIRPSIERFLFSKDFESFYFHRVRLYLESHGTQSEDEPVRLWCYVAFHDLPFAEILTADYTVDTEYVRQPRPAHHGRTGILTTSGFIAGKPGLPHFNYAAQVAEKFLGYVFEVPPEIVELREGVTAISTTTPGTSCYSCHKLLTPLAFQRSRWDDSGKYRAVNENGSPIDDSDQGLVASYPFRGEGLEAFATQAVKKERFVRTMIDTHFVFYFGRQMRYLEDERMLYRRIWERVHSDGLTIRNIIRALVTSPEYLDVEVASPPAPKDPTALRGGANGEAKDTEATENPEKKNESETAVVPNRNAAEKRP